MNFPSQSTHVLMARMEGLEKRLPDWGLRAGRRAARQSRLGGDLDLGPSRHSLLDPVHRQNLPEE